MPSFPLSHKFLASPTPPPLSDLKNFRASLFAMKITGLHHRIFYCIFFSFQGPLKRVKKKNKIKTPLFASGLPYQVFVKGPL